MVGTTSNMTTRTGEKCTAQGGSDRPVDGDVELHKQQFVAAARAIDPLAPLRRRPWTTIAFSLALGAVVATPRAGKAVSLLAPRGLLMAALRSGAAKLGAALANRNSPSKDEEVERASPSISAPRAELQPDDAASYATACDTTRG